MDLFLDILFPKKCVGCRKEGGYFCQSCVGDIKQTDLVCPGCEKLAVGGETHPICRRRYGLDGLWSLGIYKPPLREAIKQLKYKSVRQLGEVMVDILIEYWVKYQPFILDQIKKDRGAGWVVIPVPLHWWRENDRGFNQSYLIGQTLSKKLGLVYCDGLKRVRFTRSQAKLDSQQRRANIYNAFEISSNYTLNPLPYTLLIDDVWTTGSTMKECCYELKRAGVKQVWGITLAR